MKVSVDGILGSARKINSQRELQEKNLKKSSGDTKSDSITINSRLNSRLDGIEQEFRRIQSSLTRNQIIHDGIEQMRKEDADPAAVMENVRYNSKPVLAEYLNGATDAESLNRAYEKVNSNIAEDLNTLKKLQVEVDNITASNLTSGERPENLMKTISETSLRIDSISNLKPDAVMRLIR